MLNLKAKWAVDLTKETAGVKVLLGDGASVTVARWGNANHIAIEKRLKEKFSELTDLGLPIPEADAKELWVRAVAEGVLLGWDGIVDDNKASVPYTVDVGIVALSDPELHDFADLVIGKSREVALFRKTQDTVTEGNSVA